MIRATRQRPSKRLQWRGSGGRYVGKPALDAVVCPACRSLNPRLVEVAVGPFVDFEPRKACAHCGASLAAPEAP